MSGNPSSFNQLSTSEEDEEIPYRLGVYIISKGRPGNVQYMKTQTAGLVVFWVVPPSEACTYRTAGATNIIWSPESLCGARNAALNHAFALNLICVQLDDDLRQVLWWTKREIGEGPIAKISMRSAVIITIGHMMSANLRLGGGQPVNNPLNSVAPMARNIECGFPPEYTTNHFIIACFMVIRPTHLRFNEDYLLKEDYEYTVQHIKEYGGVVRVLQILPVFVHYKNAGGVASVRTDELEILHAQKLKQDYPGWFRKGRNEGELKLRAPARHCPWFKKVSGKRRTVDKVIDGVIPRDTVDKVIDKAIPKPSVAKRKHEVGTRKKAEGDIRSRRPVSFRPQIGSGFKIWRKSPKKEKPPAKKKVNIPTKHEANTRDLKRISTVDEVFQHKYCCKKAHCYVVLPGKVAPHREANDEEWEGCV